jgi:glyoxylase-like metal-dependent hydrolase (beta-lactamase superfamily II)
MEDIRRYQVGRATINRVTELVLPTIPTTFLFPEWDPAVMPRDLDWLDSGNISSDGQTLALSVHSWVVRTDQHTIVIDTGAGNGKDRPLNTIFHHLDTPYLSRLEAAGVAREDVDFVLITHLHVDHVGWNTVREGDRWVPTFPNAKYVFSKAEYEFYADPANVQTPSAGVLEDSVKPVIDAGLAILIDADSPPLLEGLKFHSTKGHSYDHLSISLESQGQTALFSGDVMHHPVQVAMPEWNSVFCEFQEEARLSRRWALDFAAQRQAHFFSSHFPGTSAGLVERKGEGFAWLPR